MIEINPIQKARLEFSRKTSALYPEWSSLFSFQEFERLFFDRCRRYEKDSKMSLYGSPNHGDQRWLYDGASKLFSVSTTKSQPKIQEERWMRINNLFAWLTTDTIALFTPLDIRNANSILALPKAWKNDIANLDELVTKEGRNGIILIRP